MALIVKIPYTANIMKAELLYMGLWCVILERQSESFQGVKTGYAFGQKLTLTSLPTSIPHGHTWLKVHPQASTASGNLLLCLDADDGWPCLHSCKMAIIYRSLNVSKTLAVRSTKIPRKNLQNTHQAP